MIFTNLKDLLAAVIQHQHFKHEVKGKRIKKEIECLVEYHQQNILLKQFQISDYGLSLYISVKHSQIFFPFQIVVSFDFPFEAPKVFYQNENSPYSYCQDLFPTILEGNNWNPSLMLTSLLDKMSVLVQLIVDGSQAIKETYHIAQIYEKSLLEKYSVSLFNVEEYQWKYMIKSINRRVLGLTRQDLLRFAVEDGKLRLISATKIKDLKEANAVVNNGKFKLNITCSKDQSKKYFFVGEEGDIQKILYFMNPVQVTERRLGSIKSQNCKLEEIKQIIQQYTQLIEYYSLLDPQKSKKYVSIVQELIKKNYHINQ